MDDKYQRLNTYLVFTVFCKYAFFNQGRKANEKAHVFVMLPPQLLVCCCHNWFIKWNPPSFYPHKDVLKTQEHPHKAHILWQTSGFLHFCHFWLAALTCGLVVQLWLVMIEITVCYHSVSMEQKNISLLRKQARTRWYRLSVDKQLAFWGPKLQFVLHRQQATPVRAAEWSRDSASHNRK